MGSREWGVEKTKQLNKRDVALVRKRELCRFYRENKKFLLPLLPLLPLPALTRQLWLDGVLLRLYKVFCYK